MSTIKQLVVDNALLLGGTIVVSIGTVIACKFLWNPKSKQITEIKAREAPKKKPKKEEHKVLLVGLDGAGKSCIMSCLSKETNRETPKPTDGFNVVCIHTQAQSLTVWEVGGAQQKYWTNFVKDTDVLVFVVDSTDKKRHPEAGKALQKLLSDSRLGGIPVLILANKQDLPGASSPAQIQEVLGLAASESQLVKTLPSAAPVVGIISGISEIETFIHDSVTEDTG